MITKVLPLKAAKVCILHIHLATLVGVEMILQSGNFCIQSYHVTFPRAVRDVRKKVATVRQDMPLVGYPCIFTLKNGFFYFVVTLLDYLKSSAAMATVPYVRAYLLLFLCCNTTNAYV